MIRRGFTLIEVVSVIGIIATMAAILFPVFARAREIARRNSCASNLQQIGMALRLYAQENTGLYPKKNNDFAALHPYTKQQGVFWCPSDSEQSTYIPANRQKPAKPDPVVYSSYVFKGGLTNDDRRDLTIGGESEAFHVMIVNTLRLDGSVKALGADGYKPIVKPKRRPKMQPDVGPPPMPGPMGP